MKRKQPRKNKQLKAGSRPWHEQQLRECLAIAQKTTHLATEAMDDNINRAQFHQMQAIQASMQAMVHGLLMLNPEMYVEYSEDKKED